MNYTEQANEVLRVSRSIARELRHPYIGTEHLLIGLRRIYSGVAGQILASNGVEEENILKVVNELVSPMDGGESAKNVRPQPSPRLQYILEESEEEAVRSRSDKIGTEHLLLALLHDTDSVAARTLMTLNINLQRIMQETLEVLGVDTRAYQEELQGGHRSDGVMEQYGTDLTAQAEEGKLDPVVGREKEISRLMQVLSRRTKNNPCLIGEPGVGKTAVIEGLATQIAEGIVPESMKNKRILTMDLAGLIAGSKYRGEFEDRMKKLIQEVKVAGNVILFLDEVHTIIGAGGAEGAIDASNILKPSLARGEIQLIGATTITEYRKYIEKDAALERRFQPITVEEPSEEMCVEILEGLCPRYETHHHVEIEKSALRAAVQLSNRYINDRFMPDKAIDVLDEACSRAGLRGFKVPDSVHVLEKKLEEFSGQLEETIRRGDIAAASLVKKEEDETRKKLEQVKKRFQKKCEGKNVTVTEEDIADVVSQWTKIPVQKLTESDTERLRHLETVLHKRVVGQDEAVTAVAKAVKRGRVGLKDPKRPIGSFLFLGPTGVGKTELSKALAEALFGDEESMIRVDMSEYMEKHSVSKMIGSPPGYVGYDEGGQLSDKVRRNPYSVILFDEVEKAHPDVFNVLLQVLDDGHITDSKGRKVSFKNTIIIMTSNVGANRIVDPKNLGFGVVNDEKKDYEKMKSDVMEEVKLMFKPEFINRIDDIIVFHSLTEKEVKNIVGIMLKNLAKQVKEQMAIELKFTETLKNMIAKESYDKKFGARPLRRKIQSKVEDALAEEVLSGNVNNNDKVTVSCKNGKVTFKVDRENKQEN